MAEINLVGKHGAGKKAIIDDSDLDIVSKYRWFLSRDNMVYSSMRVGISETGLIIRRNIALHQLILNTRGLGIIVDHKDHNRLNNKRENLRTCSNAQNGQNRRPNSGRKYKGITEENGKYRVRIQANGKRYNLGVYADLEQAVLAYNAKAKLVHGDYACPI